MLRGRNYPAPDREDDYSDVDGDGSSRWTKAGTVCAVIFSAIMLSSVGIIAYDGVAGDDPSRAADPQAATSLGPSVAAGTVPSSSRSDGPADPNSPIPAQVTWVQVGYGALPFSATAGPSTIRGGSPSGFAHSRAGSVQAAIQILGRLSWSAQSKASMQAVVSSATTPAAQAAVVLSYGPPTDPSVIPQVAGFQVVTYSDTQAVMNVALRFNGALRVSPATVQWVSSATGSGDWKLSGAPGPLSETNWAQVQDLTGYTLFSGQPTKEGD